MASGFDDVWEPRIGSAAAALLRGSYQLTLVLAVVWSGSGVGCGFAFSSGSRAGVLLGWFGVAVAGAAVSIWMRSRAQLAAAISQWFGVTIRWQEMPRMRTAEFDSWCRDRGLSVTR